ncbi:MAG: hypothetical protein K2G98_05290, partial [Duncaniella sp.]|nr:hypothetical protein [Duncaniella sp.]
MGSLGWHYSLLLFICILC